MQTSDPSWGKVGKDGLGGFPWLVFVGRRMNNRWLILFASALSLGAPSSARAAAPLVVPVALKGVVTGGIVVTFQQEELPEGGDLVLAWLAPLAGRDAPRRVAWPSSPVAPPTWHVGHGACWLACRDFSVTREVDRLFHYDLRRFLREPHWKGPGHEEGAVAVSLFAEPNLLRWRRILGYRVEYDYLPVAKDKVKLFLLGPGAAKRGKEPSWSFAVHSCQASFNKEIGHWERHSWVDEGKIAVAFREAFQVLGKGDDYYFVTSSGRLFVSRKAAKGKQRSCVPVWSDASRPIRAFITDADADRAFLFVGPAKGGGRPAFFELSDRPRLVEYDPRSAKPLKEGPERLRRVTHYARVLLAHKLVKDR
jgi:hypothetical protein